jgi:hypothetical protein
LILRTTGIAAVLVSITAGLASILLFAAAFPAAKRGHAERSAAVTIQTTSGPMRRRGLRRQQ